MKDLAYNKRPKNFQQLIGQTHLFGENAQGGFEILNLYANVDHQLQAD